MAPSLLVLATVVTCGAKTSRPPLRYNQVGRVIALANFLINDPCGSLEKYSIRVSEYFLIQSITNIVYCHHAGIDLYT
jgi:hypothetical protein